MYMKIFLFSGGFIKGFLSLMTFRRPSTRDVGCGVYLFVSSITSMLIFVILLIKMTFLLVSQLKLLKQRPLLQLQCQTIDYLLRVFLVIVDWLHACGTVERTINVFKGIHFNQRLSMRRSSRSMKILSMLLISRFH